MNAGVRPLLKGDDFMADTDEEKAETLTICSSSGFTREHLTNVQDGEVGSVSGSTLRSEIRVSAIGSQDLFINLA